MKKSKKILLVLVMMLASFLNIQAVNGESSNEFEFKNSSETTSKEDVNGSSLLVGNIVNSNNKIEGIGLIGANTVNFKGENDYSLIFGNIANIDGKINKDGFLFGNLITLSSQFKVDRDLFIFGNEVIIDGEIGRNITIFANTVSLKGKVNGNVTIKATNIEIKDDATIIGSLKYNEDAKTIISQNAKIGSTILGDKFFNEISFSNMVMNTLYSLIGILVVFMAFSFITPKMFEKINKRINKITVTNVLALTGYGALTLILVPILFFVLLTLFFGVPLALLLLTIYIIVICLANMFTGYFIGSILWNKVFKKEKNVLLEGLIGISLIILLGLIPFVNTLIMIISLLLGVGLVVNLFKKDSE